MYTDKVGDKITIHGTVIRQESQPVDTPRGRVYSNFHLIQDQTGRLFQYKGSSHFPLNHQVAIKATIKTYYKGLLPSKFITVVAAPKPV